MANAAVPALIWTGEPPAKSREPKTANQPFSFQVQCAIGLYTIIVQQSMKIIEGRSLPRSASAPIAITTVIHANVPWYHACTKIGRLDMSWSKRFVKPPNDCKSPM